MYRKKGVNVANTQLNMSLPVKADPIYQDQGN